MRVEEAQISQPGQPGQPQAAVLVLSAEADQRQSDLGLVTNRDPCQACQDQPYGSQWSGNCTDSSLLPARASRLLVDRLLQALAETYLNTACAYEYSLPNGTHMLITIPLNTNPRGQVSPTVLVFHIRQFNMSNEVRIETTGIEAELTKGGIWK